MSLIARGLEHAGMPTVLVSVREPVSRIAGPPRQVVRKGNVGSTVGRPGDADGQRRTLERMLALLEHANEHGAVERDG